MLKTKNRSARQVLQHLSVSALVSIIVLAALYRLSVDEAQNFNIWQKMTGLLDGSWKLLLGYVFTIVTMNMVRAYRYTILIGFSASDTKPPNNWPMFLVTTIRAMVVDFLPFRLGELVFITVLNRYANIRTSVCLSCVIFSSSFDLAVLVPSVIFIALALSLPTITILKISLTVGLILLLVYLSIRYVLPLSVGFLNRLVGKSNNSTKKLISYLGECNRLFQLTFDRGYFGKILFLSILLRVLKILSLLVLFKSVIFASHSSMVSIPDAQLLGALLSSEISGALPIPSLMGFGLWEGGGFAYLSSLKLPLEDIFYSLLTVNIQAKIVGYSLATLCAAILFVFYTKRSGI